jgi:lipoprotein NlpD
MSDPSLVTRHPSPLKAAFALATACLLLLLASCASEPTRTSTYTVRRGDTLYAIAWRYRLDYQELARLNGIGRDYMIHPGQVLRLSASAPPRKSKAKVAAKKPAIATKPPSAPRIVGPPVRWQWPVEGGAAALTTRPNGGQGLTINGRAGQEVRSAGSGRVVYTGSGLLGYGQLLIIKHNDTYLSAYGHTQSVLVREHQDVVAGQRVATMGSGPQGTPMLYFEIRINGTPSNPLLLLPQR